MTRATMTMARAKHEDPYGVSQPITRMALAAIYLATGKLPKSEVMDRLASEAGVEDYDGES